VATLEEARRDSHFVTRGIFPSPASALAVPLDAAFRR
jgi:hypothetical protein